MAAADTGGDTAARDGKRENKRLSDLVAVTVVVLSVFMAISKTKDDNINQAMQKAKADAVNAWAEYQFGREPPPFASYLVVDPERRHMLPR